MQNLKFEEVDAILDALIEQRSNLTKKISLVSNYDERQSMLVRILSLDDLIQKMLGMAATVTSN